MKKNVTRRPAGATAAVAGLLVLVLGWCDVDLSAQDAVTLVSGLTVLVSLWRPIPLDG